MYEGGSGKLDIVKGFFLFGFSLGCVHHELSPYNSENLSLIQKLLKLITVFEPTRN